MNSSERKTASSPSLWLATAAAAGIALLLLVTVVMPAEHGIDPTGIGRLLGLDALNPALRGDDPAGSEEGVEVAGELLEEGLRIAGPGLQKSYAASYRQQDVSIDLDAFEEVEFKARLEEGDTILYSWVVDGDVYVDMHGEPYTFPQDDALRYEEKDGVTSGHGRLTAPFAGHHGWYWLNVTEEPVTVRLRVSGFYGALEEVHRAQR